MVQESLDAERLYQPDKEWVILSVYLEENPGKTVSPDEIKPRVIDGEWVDGLHVLTGKKGHYRVENFQETNTKLIRSVAEGKAAKTVFNDLRKETAKANKAVNDKAKEGLSSSADAMRKILEMAGVGGPKLAQHATALAEKGEDAGAGADGKGEADDSDDESDDDDEESSSGEGALEHIHGGKKPGAKSAAKPAAKPASKPGSRVSNTLASSRSSATTAPKLPPKTSIVTKAAAKVKAAAAGATSSSRQISVLCGRGQRLQSSMGDLVTTLNTTFTNLNDEWGAQEWSQKMWLTTSDDKAMRAFFKSHSKSLAKLISESDTGINRIEASANKEALQDTSTRLKEFRDLVQDGPAAICKLMQSKTPGPDEFVEATALCSRNSIVIPRCAEAEHLRSLVAQHAQYEHYSKMPDVGDDDDSEFVMYAVEEVLFKLLRSIKPSEVDKTLQQCDSKVRANKAIMDVGETKMFELQNFKVANDLLNCHTVSVLDLKAALDYISDANKVDEPEDDCRVVSFFTKKNGHAIGHKLLAVAAQVLESRSAEAQASLDLQRIKDWVDIPQTMLALRGPKVVTVMDSPWLLEPDYSLSATASRL